LVRIGNIAVWHDVDKIYYQVFAQHQFRRFRAAALTNNKAANNNPMCFTIHLSISQDIGFVNILDRNGAA
jgi:hypothetical protein